MHTNTHTPTPHAQEGYYNLSAAVSLITDFPRLVNLTGLNGITQDDESGTSSGERGGWRGSIAGAAMGPAPTASNPPPPARAASLWVVSACMVPSRPLLHALTH